MLTETLLLGTTYSPSVDTPTITLLNLHTGHLITTHKRSHTSARGLASTSTHLIAQQSDKAVLNIYSLATSTLETAVPLPEKFTVIATSADSNLLAGGTSDGRVYVWELSSGRWVATPGIHLQAVTALCFSSHSNHLVSGSEDAKISIWSLAQVLDAAPTGQRAPVHVLNRHIDAVTAVVVGRASSGGGSELLVSAGRDRTVMTWDLATGQHLRTYMLEEVPRCLIVDPAERAVYVGLEEGGVRAIELHNSLHGGETSLDKLRSASEMYDEQYRDRPVPVAGDKWTAKGNDSAVLSIEVSYEGNLVITGADNGEVALWDVATGYLYKILTRLGAPVSTLKLLPTTGFTNTTTRSVSTPVLPKSGYDAILAAPSIQNLDLSTYAVSVTFPKSTPETSTSALSTVFHNPPIHTFSPESDMQEIMKGAQQMKAYKPALAGRQKVEALENELTGLYESYERLAEVHKKTWSRMVGMALEDEENGAAARTV